MIGNQPAAYRRTVAISVASTDQTLTTPALGVYVQSTGNLVVRLVNDAADSTFTGLLAGTIYPIQVLIVRKTGSTAAGLLLY